jgi:hypothetical protein
MLTGKVEQVMMACIIRFPRACSPIHARMVVVVEGRRGPRPSAAQSSCTTRWAGETAACLRSGASVSYSLLGGGAARLRSRISSEEGTPRGPSPQGLLWLRRPAARAEAERKRRGPQSTPSEAP